MDYTRYGGGPRSEEDWRSPASAAELHRVSRSVAGANIRINGSLPGALLRPCVCRRLLFLPVAMAAVSIVSASAPNCCQTREPIAKGRKSPEHQATGQERLARARQHLAFCWS